MNGPGSMALGAWLRAKVLICFGQGDGSTAWQGDLFRLVAHVLEGEGLSAFRDFLSGDVERERRRDGN